MGHRRLRPRSVARRLLACVIIITTPLPGGCSTGRHTPAQRTLPTNAPTNASAPAALVGEAQRELTAMRSTHYQHTTRVNEDDGRYFYDCSGFLDYALGRVLPGDAKALPVSTSVRPLAGDIEHFLRQGLKQPLDGWSALSRIDSLQPGDVIAWLATEDSTTGDTGHVMVVLGVPSAKPARQNEWTVAVADSTLNPHSRDSRRDGVTGLGTGTIGLIADTSGAPTAFYWRGGESQQAKPTEIALGRPV